MSFQANIAQLTRENSFFRKVIYTGKYSQLVLMSVETEIGEETHPEVDQILFFVEGGGEAILAGESSPVGEGDVVFVPAGTLHNFKNTQTTPLKLYTVYSPPQHPDGTIHKTKEEVEAVQY